MPTATAAEPSAAQSQQAHKSKEAPKLQPDSSIYPLSVDNINQCVRSAQYAVRGEIVQRAGELEAALKKGEKLPFDKVLYCNIGNPQQLGQPALTWLRQVACLCDYPQLLDVPETERLFPADVRARAREYLDHLQGGTGAYSHSQGAPICRQHVAEGIARRDGGIACDPDSLFLSDGASPGVHALMRLLLRNERDAILTPVPQYPLYSATIALYGGTLVPYYLDESAGWGMDVSHLRHQVAQARKDGLCVRALVVINPGNPTGQCLSYENQRDVIAFAREAGLVLIADEVYQDNIYAAGKQFVSFKRVLTEMGDAAGGVTLASLHSISKGFYGECGRRGGYTELVGASAEVQGQLYKMASINLCSNVAGQICMALVMKPPQEGDPSYEQYAKERGELLGSLARRARLLTGALRRLEGVTCTEVEGALYAFPAVSLPPAACQEAARAGRQPDFLYCSQLLEATGIVVVPGSGFRQAEGSWHFRATILPPEADMEAVTQRISDFHQKFMDKYRNGAGGNGAGGKHS